MAVERKNTNILMIEDNPYDARLIKEVLKELGFEHNIHTITTGTNALNYLNQLQKHGKLRIPDLVLLDLILPDINGMEILKHIRSDFNLKYIPVVIITMSHEHENIVHAYQNQVNAYITKPANYEDCLNALGSLMPLFGFKKH